MNFETYLKETLEEVTKQDAFKAIFNKSADGKEKIRDFFRGLFNAFDPIALHGLRADVVEAKLEKLGFSPKDINLIGLRAKSTMKKILLADYDESDIKIIPELFFKYWHVNSAMHISDSKLEEIFDDVEYEFKKSLGL